MLLIKSLYPTPLIQINISAFRPLPATTPPPYPHPGLPPKWGKVSHFPGRERLGGANGKPSAPPPPSLPQIRHETYGGNVAFAWRIWGHSSPLRGAGEYAPRRCP